MIQIYLNNELLDIDPANVVTFKKSQQLNGVQDLYSFSNTFNLKNSSKNRRLLKINYLPNSKAQSITVGYDVDVVFSGCIFLKNQKLKVQKETAAGLPVYLIFTDSNFLAKAKSITLNQIGLGVSYGKTLAEFEALNAPSDYVRTAPISAQDTSGFISLDETPQLLNIKTSLTKIFDFMGYAYSGDLLTDTDLPKFFMSPNVGVYGPEALPSFADTLTVYDFIINFLKTFNGYIEVSDSSRAIGLYFWKNIETIKSRFVDYSDHFVNFKEYVCEGGLAKLNTMTYADSPDFYNGYFDNNKSIENEKNYLSSGFGAGTLRLFGDQELQEDGKLELRPIGEKTDPQTINIFKFEDTIKSTGVYTEGLPVYANVYRAFSPNILEIWQRFHKKYCDNIALPTTGLFTFRYDAVFLSEFRMSEVFFVKQLSTYWLPLELNFTSKKENIQVKCLMIEKTRTDAPEVFDFNVSVGFFGEVVVNDINLLYSILNTSPADTLIIESADLAKNNIFINGTQILAFPTPIDVSTNFEIVIQNNDPINQIDNSNILFQFVSQDGGISRTATLNVAHNGRANYLSEFRSNPAEVFVFERNDTNGVKVRLNYSAQVSTQIDIPDSFAPIVGELPYGSDFPVSIILPPYGFKVLELDRAGVLKIDLSIGRLYLHCSNRGGGAEARTKVFFNVWKNGALLTQMYNAVVIDRFKSGSRNQTWLNVSVSRTINAQAGDVILIEALADLSEENRAGSGTMDGRIEMTDVIWKFSTFEQL